MSTAGSGETDCARTWAALSQAHAVLSVRLGAALRESCGLSITEFEVLLRLDAVQPPGVRLCELNRTVRLSQPAFSRLTARLERQDLVRRVGDAADRRAVRVAITSDGRDRLSRAVAAHASCLRDALAATLSATERAMLADVLVRIAVAAPG